jgi:ribonuclease HI
VTPALEHVIALELSLLDPDVRRTPERVELLLHADFCEYGASGRIYDRESIVAALATEPGSDWEASDVRAREVSGGVVLVTYRASGSLRSSLWIEGLDGWRMLFHQGTPAP